MDGTIYRIRIIIAGEMRQVDVGGHPVLLCRDQGDLKVNIFHNLIVKTVIWGICNDASNEKGHQLNHYFKLIHDIIVIMLQAYSSKCTHYGAPLVNGHLEGGLIRWLLFQDRDKYPKICLSGQSEMCCQVPLARCLLLGGHRRHRGLPGSGQPCLTSGDRRHIEELHDGVKLKQFSFATYFVW